MERIFKILAAKGVTVDESFVGSKRGGNESAEDAIFIQQDFLGVIDGVTSKTGYCYEGKTAGHYAVDVISRAFADLPATIEARQAVDMLTRTVKEAAEQYQLPDTESMAAAFAVISLGRHELWIIGDCQALLDGQLIRYENRVDKVMSEARALWLELDRLSGSAVQMNPDNDPGRVFIMPLLKRQKLLHNRSDSVYGYAILNGYPVPDEGIRIIPLDDVEEVVLATDGYPVLRPTLADSESELQLIITSDPMMSRDFPSTKGVVNGNVSFDDRAYLRITLQNCCREDKETEYSL